MVLTCKHRCLEGIFVGTSETFIKTVAWMKPCIPSLASQNQHSGGGNGKIRIILSYKELDASLVYMRPCQPTMATMSLLQTRISPAHNTCEQ